MGWLMDLAAWLGLTILTGLVVLRAVESFVLLNALSVRLPSDTRDRVRRSSVLWFLAASALFAVLAQWVMRFDTPLLSVGLFHLSLKDLMYLVGGFYLLAQATSDLMDYGQGKSVASGDSRVYKSWTYVSVQALVVVSFLSLEVVALGLVVSNDIVVWLAAYVIGAAAVWFGLQPMARFVSIHRTALVLAAGFVLMSGFALLAKPTVGFEVAPYLYVAIVFSGLVAVLWYLAQRKALVPQVSARERLVETVLRMFGQRLSEQDGEDLGERAEQDQTLPLGIEQRNMMSGVLTLSERSVNSIMTPRTEVSWIDIDDEPQRIREQIEQAPHSFFPVCRGNLDNIIGIGRAKRMIADLLTHGRIQQNRLREPIIVHDTIDIMRLIGTLKNSRGQLVLVADEFGAIEGLVTPIDVFEAIAGEFPDEDEAPDIVPDGENRWRVDGAADLHILEQELEIDGLVNEDEEYSTLAGYLLNHFGRLPNVGEGFTYETGACVITFKVVRLERRRIAMVHVEKRERGADPPTGD